MRKTILVKMGIILVGAILVAYTAYLRSLGTREYLPATIGIIFIIIGIVTFFFGGEGEEEIEQEELKEEETERGKI